MRLDDFVEEQNSRIDTLADLLEGALRSVKAYEAAVDLAVEKDTDKNNESMGEAYQTRREAVGELLAFLENVAGIQRTVVTNVSR